MISHKFIPRKSECNGDVIRRRYSVADRGTVRGNVTHTGQVLRGTSLCEEAGLSCVHQILHCKPRSSRYEGCVPPKGNLSASTNKSMGAAWSYRGMIGPTGELDCSRAHICLREATKLKDKTECRCEVMDSRAMGMTTPWYRKGETSVESLIPCSHRGRALGREKVGGGGECRGNLQVPRQG
ncbi:hypothetical protein BHE74_00045938 [Ensete ventricosum]|nr:hypothetical protein BHE74_00045938 [Ensete ventricosum]